MRCVIINNNVPVSGAAHGDVMKAKWKRGFNEEEMASRIKFSWDVELDEFWELSTGVGKV